MRDAVIIICTRPDSSRVPRKVFRKICGTPAIEILLQRIAKCGLEVVLAIPKGCQDYFYLGNKYSVSIFEGNPLSPLHRMAEALDIFTEKWVVRITHDDILIDVDTMLSLIDECERSIPNEDCGYGITPEIIEGAGVEVIHRDNIIEAAKNRKDPTEFVSYFVKSYPHAGHVSLSPRSSIKRNYRLTLDYAEDFIVLESVLRHLGTDASLDRIAAFLDRNSYVLRLNKLPVVSIYTCVHNGDKFLDRTMQSVLVPFSSCQFEYIVVDDASSDKTLLSAMRYNHDPRVNYIVNDTNKGLASSSNIALSHARGDYVMRVDADDYLYPNAIDTLLWKLNNEKHAIVYPAFHQTDENDSFHDFTINPRDCHHVGGALMAKRMINEVRFTDNLRHWDGQDLYMRIKDKFSIGYIDTPLWCYRVHSESMSRNNLEERKSILKDIKKQST